MTIEAFDGELPENPIPVAARRPVARDRLRRRLIELGGSVVLSWRTCKVVVGDWPLFDGPALVVANHSCILDMPAAVHVSRAVGYDWTMLASPRTSRRYGRLYGDRCLSVGHDAVSMDLGLRRAANLLNGSDRILIWTFPQGDYVIPSAPLVFRPGVSALLRRAPQTTVVCAGIRYEMFRRDLPMCAIGFEVVPPSARHLPELVLATERALHTARALIEQAAPSVRKRF